MSLVRPLRLLLLGAPGAGKGTQTTRLLKLIPSLSSISSGDLLRLEILRKTEIGNQASSYISKGALLPDSIMVDLVYGNLQKLNWLNNETSWLLDGFPRTANQAIALDTKLSESNSAINLVVEIDVPEEVILERIENRWVHIPSGRVYNLQYNPPKVAGKDDVTGEPLSKRPDDNSEVFKKRLETYHKEISPLKAFYKQQGVLSTVSGETSDIVFPKLLSLITEKFGK